MTPEPETQVQTETWGDVPRHIVRHAAARVSSLLAEVSEPVRFARVKLTLLADPAVRRPAIAQVTADLNGRPVRAQADGRIMHEAAEHVCDRLRTQLLHATWSREAVRGGRPVPAPGEWRHQSLPLQRLPYYPRPAQARDVMRRKSYPLDRETPEEAAAEVELRDYYFHLFTERATGLDGVICRSADGYRLQLAVPRADELGPVDEAIVVSAAAAPRLSMSETAAGLESSGQPFLFFADSERDRGNVLYHRYDGHYGLIVPSAD